MVKNKIDNFLPIPTTFSTSRSGKHQKISSMALFKFKKRLNSYIYWYRNTISFLYLLIFNTCNLLFSCPVVSNSLWAHGPQPAGPLCSSPSPKVCPSSCPLHQWCHPAISSSDALFSFCLQSFPVSGIFPMSQLFSSDDQNARVSASKSVLPMSIQGWFPLRLTGLISLLSKGLSEVFSSTTVWRHQFFRVLPSLQSSSHNHTWPLGRP